MLRSFGWGTEAVLLENLGGSFDSLEIAAQGELGASGRHALGVHLTDCAYRCPRSRS